jgi:hypothetical protein
MGLKINVPKGISLPGIDGKFYDGSLDDLMLKFGKELQKD